MKKYVTTRREFLKVATAFAAGSALVGARGILITVRKYDETFFERGLNYLLDMLNPVREVKK